MYNFTYHRPSTIADAVRLLEDVRRRQGHVRRPDADPDDEAAAGAAQRHHRSDGAEEHRHCGVRLDARHQGGNLPCRGRGKPRGGEGNPGTGGAGRLDRRSAGPPQGNARRLDRQQRSGGRLSGRAGGARRHGASPMRAGSPPTSSSPPCSRPRSTRTRSSRRWNFPFRSAPAMQSSATRHRAMPWSACSWPIMAAAMSGWRSPGRVLACSGSATWRRRWPGRSRPTRCGASRPIRPILNSDIHASAEYRAHLVGVMARRAVQAALSG